MSSSTVIEIPYHHSQDCRYEGCPGHVMRGQYHGTSDTWWVESDNGTFAHGEHGDLEAFLRMIAAMGEQRAEVESMLRRVLSAGSLLRGETP